MISVHLRWKLRRNFLSDVTFGDAITMSVVNSVASRGQAWMHEKRTVHISQKSTDTVPARDVTPRADGPAEIADPAQAVDSALTAGLPETWQAADSAGEPSTALVEEPCQPGTAKSVGLSRVDEPTRQGPASHVEPAGGCWYVTGWLGRGFPGRCFIATIDLQTWPSTIARDSIDTAASSRESRCFWWLGSYVISIYTQGHQPRTTLGLHSRGEFGSTEKRATGCDCQPGNCVIAQDSCEEITVTTTGMWWTGQDSWQVSFSSQKIKIYMPDKHCAVCVKHGCQRRFWDRRKEEL